MKCKMTLGALLLMTAFTAVHAQQAQGAKELFYGTSGETTIVTANNDSVRPVPEKPGRAQPPSVADATAPRARPGVKTAARRSPQTLGLMTSVRLVSTDNSIRTVSPSTKFKSGDVIQLTLQSNKPGYLYVVNIGSTGKETVMFPARSTDDNRVEAFHEYVIPARMRFDSNPGVEQLVVALSPTPTTSVQTRAMGMKMVTISTRPGMSTGGNNNATRVAATAPADQTIIVTPTAPVTPSYDNVPMPRTGLELADSSGSRDLVLDDYKDEGVLVAVRSFVPGKAPQSMAPLVLNLKLAHE